MKNMDKEVEKSQEMGDVASNGWCEREFLSKRDEVYWEMYYQQHLEMHGVVSQGNI